MKNVQSISLRRWSQEIITTVVETLETLLQQEKKKKRSRDEQNVRNPYLNRSSLSSQEDDDDDGRKVVYLLTFGHILLRLLPLDCCCYFPVYLLCRRSYEKEEKSLSLSSDCGSPFRQMMVITVIWFQLLCAAV